jgi:hypothetical protein
MNLLSIGKGIFDIVGKLDGNSKEKKELDIELSKLINESNAKIIEAENVSLKLQEKTINNELTKGSFIQRNWRPVSMLTFLFLIILDSFGLLSKPLSPMAWELIKLGLGGYVVGRSFEKIMPSLMGAVKK